MEELNDPALKSRKRRKKLERKTIYDILVGSRQFSVVS